MNLFEVPVFHPDGMQSIRERDGPVLRNEKDAVRQEGVAIPFRLDLVVNRNSAERESAETGV